MTWLLLSIIGVILYTTFRNKRDFFHPSRIYILLYSLLFAVYFLRLSRFQEPWSPTTLMLFWGAVVSFVGGGMLVTFYVNHVALIDSAMLNVHSVTHRLYKIKHEVNWSRFCAIIVVIFLMFAISYLRSYMLNGFIPMFSSDPNSDRFLFLTGSYFTDIAGGSGPLVMMLCAEVLLVKDTTTKQRVIAGIILVLSFLMYFTLVTRMPLVRTGIYITVLYHYFKKPISFKLISMVTFLIVILFVIGAVIRIDVGGFAELSQSLRIKIPSQFILLINPYAYAVNNIWNMDFGFKKFIDGYFAYNHSFGFEMFRPMFYYLRIDNIIQTAYNFDSVYNDSIVKVSGLNSVVYIWHLYKDFGLFGIFFVSLLLGILLHFFYYNTLLTPSPIRISIYGIIVSMIVFSFMIPLWSFWNIYYEFGVLIFTHQIIKTV